MHFMGQEAISRPTRGAGRILIDLSFVIWFAKHYDVSFQELEFNGITLPAAEDGHVFVQWLVMVVLIASHVMNWWGDRVSYKGWNTRERVTGLACGDRPRDGEREVVPEEPDVLGVPGCSPIRPFFISAVRLPSAVEALRIPIAAAISDLEGATPCART